MANIKKRLHSTSRKTSWLSTWKWLEKLCPLRVEMRCIHINGTQTLFRNVNCTTCNNIRAEFAGSFTTRAQLHQRWSILPSWICKPLHTYLLCEISLVTRFTSSFVYFVWQKNIAVYYIWCISISTAVRHSDISSVWAAETGDIHLGQIKKFKVHLGLTKVANMYSLFHVLPRRLTHLCAAFNV